MRSRRSISMILAATTILSAMTGCGASEKKANIPSYEMVPGQTLSGDSKWIASSVIGAIDESVKVELKDDFYTAANKEKILEAVKNVPQGADVQNYSTGTFEYCHNLTVNSVSELLSKADEYLAGGDIPNNIGIPEDIIRHYYELCGKAYKQLKNWDERDEKGVTPLIPYLEAIDKIGSMEEMKDYFLNKNGVNPFLRGLADYDINVTGELHEEYYCIVGPMQSGGFSLGDPKHYSKMDADAISARVDFEKLIYSVTDKAGYDRDVIKNKISDCYKIEEQLADIYLKEIEDKEDLDQIYSYQEAIETLGDYPISDLLDKYGYEKSEHYVLSKKGYLSRLSRVYKAENLEALKNYFFIHMILDSAEYLDRESFELSNDTCRRNAELEEKGNEILTVNAEVDPDDEIAFSQIGDIIPGPMNYIFAASACGENDKKYLMDMTKNIVESHRKMILSEDWMSEETKAKTIEKLDAIGINVLYPDTFVDYKELSFEKADNLLEIIGLNNEDAHTRRAENINKKFERTGWDLSEVPTANVNAFYMPERNNIYILAGICMDDDVFNVNGSKEANYASIGTVVGHEITHAFDTFGSKYTWDGYEKNWWTNADRQAFEKRAEKVVSYFGSLSPLNGVTTYSGSQVKNEAVADMGAMKSVLQIAAMDSDWDYDTFFRAYENFWFQLEYYDYAKMLTEKDEHPLSYFRGNVTVMQFDEFADCYGVKKGDGMYLAEKNRILVW